MPVIYKVKDNSSSYYKDKGDLINLCMRLIIVGASERSGKTNLIVNLLLRNSICRLTSNEALSAFSS